MDNIRNLLNQIAIISKKNAEILDAFGGRFNMFKICGVNHYENTHSAILAEFLNPNGTHGLKSKLLKCFVEMFCNDDIKQNFKIEKANVFTEYSVNEGRIDILIKDNENHAIIIENKIYAADQWEQLKRYKIFASKEYGESKYQIFYLTLGGNEATKQSSEGVDYKSISYQTNIITWLEKCVCIGVHFPMVRETINQYINHLKSLTNQDMSTKNIEEIVDVLSKNIESTFIIADNLTYLKNYLINKIFLPQLSEICKELGLSNVSEEYDRVNESLSDFQIMNPKWKTFKIGFEFETRGLANFIIGVNHIGDIRKDETFEKLKPFFARKNDNWVWNPFPTYSYWGKEAMIAIKNGEMANIFKEEITKILELTKGFDM
ncbi:MAG: PD-(D/E)XK nuclease family protein [Dysgonamonadaceae bacterium]|nr:PD-(D/E)XK nuclease family protein [Dysgonamonadaceae bacterium]